MYEEWQANSLCVSSSDSGRFTDYDDFQESDSQTVYKYQQFNGSTNRFTAYRSQNHRNNNLAKGVFLRNLKPIPIDPSIDPIFSSCFNCWQFGHTYQDCYLPRNHKFCVNCGRMHILIDSCPRCGRAYHLYSVYKDMKLKKQKEVDGFSYNYGCDYYYYDEVDQDDVSHSQFETTDHRSESYSTSFSQNSYTNSPEEEYYYAYDETGSYCDDLIVDEDEKSHEPVSDLLRDFLKLLDYIKQWPIEVQNTILLNYVAERRRQLP